MDGYGEGEGGEEKGEEEEGGEGERGRRGKVGVTEGTIVMWSRKRRESLKTETDGLNEKRGQCSQRKYGNEGTPRFINRGPVYGSPTQVQKTETKKLILYRVPTLSDHSHPSPGHPTRRQVENKLSGTTD